jgi:hypothetical protein
MSAREHINQTLFHGTAHDFQIGDVIAPASSLDNSKDVKREALDRAWASPSRHGAEGYAAIRASSAGKLFGNVYEVEPVDWNESETGNSMGYIADESLDVSSYKDKGVVDGFPHSVHSKKGFKVVSGPTFRASENAFVTPDEAMYDHKGRKVGHPDFRED